MKRHTNKLNVENKAVPTTTVSAKDLAVVCGGSSPPIRALVNPQLKWLYLESTPAWALKNALCMGYTTECLCTGKITNP